jgi:hypothetical protein
MNIRTKFSMKATAEPNTTREHIPVLAKCAQQSSQITTFYFFRRNMHHDLYATLLLYAIGENEINP